MKTTQQEINIINEKLKELQIPATLTPGINNVIVTLATPKPSPFKTYEVEITRNSNDFDISLHLDWRWVYNSGGSNGTDEYFFFDKESKQWR